MFHDIFTNVSILISFLLIIGQIFKNNTFNIKQTYKFQSLLGIVFGILGIVLMLFTIKMTDTVIIDLRNIPIICAGILGGPVAAMTSAIVIGVFRLLHFGISTASIVAHLIAWLVGIEVAFISVLKLSRLNKLIYMFIFAMVLSNFALFYIVRDLDKLIEILAYYWPIYLFGAILACFTCEYIISANINNKINQYYRITADNVSDMITTHESGGKIKFVSPTVYKLFGYTQEEFIGTNSYNYIHPDDVADVRNSFSSLKLSGEDTMQTLRMKKKDGSYVWVEISVKIINASDGTMEMVCVTRDISDRKEIENELKHAKEQAEKLAYTDYLTGVLNRRAFENRVYQEFNRVLREESSISIIITDLDYFKKINDNYGHQAGDHALREFTKCLSNMCRPYDFIGRYGGEEFIICLPNTDCEQAEIIADRMRKAVEELKIYHESDMGPVHLTASFGVSSSTPDIEEDVEILILNADKAMYKAKTCGRNMVCTN